MPKNKGEWSEPYVALRILGDQKLYIADENDNKNLNEFMNVLELIRHETVNRIVKYRYQPESTIVDIFVNDELSISLSAETFVEYADKLSAEIKEGKGKFDVSNEMTAFFNQIELHHIKAKSVDKSDIFLTAKDTRANVVREHIGFSIKSEFGQNPTLFNTAKASAVVYEVSGMTNELMEYINSLYDEKGNTAVSERCEALLSKGCTLSFAGFPFASRAGCKAFEENLDLIDNRLPQVIERMLWYHFFDGWNNNDIKDVVTNVIEKNPCNITRPETKYPYMIKSFLYAAYSGMTASTVWNGDSQVNGGFIKVNKYGDVLAYYALESDSFKSYLYKNCYLEFPSTDEKHGHYAKVYEENGKYYFRLNFQIRYR